MRFHEQMGRKIPAAFVPMRSRGSLAEDRRLEQGAWLFLVSLTVFFFSCMLLYTIYVMLRIAPAADQIQPFYVPRSFLITTVNLVAISTLLHMAVGAARRERIADLSRYIVVTFLLSLAFFVTQGFGLATMVGQMLQPEASMRNLYGLTFFLVIIHALHVVGGVAALVILLFGLRRKAYDHERYFPVKFCALYWHFLDIVWVVMMIAFAIAAFVSQSR